MMAFPNHFYLYWTFTLTLSVGSESRGVAWTDFDEEAWGVFGTPCVQITIISKRVLQIRFRSDSKQTNHNAHKGIM